MKAFLNDKNIDNSYNKGYFLHLITDFIFYNKFIEYYSTDIYNDYDILNKPLMERFNVKLPKEVKDKVFYKEGITKILNLDKTVDFIKNVAKYKLDDVKQQVIDEDEYWCTFINLKHIPTEG